MTRNREIDCLDLTECTHEPETPITSGTAIIGWRCRCGRKVPAAVVEANDPINPESIEEHHGWIVSRHEIDNPDGNVAVQMIGPKTMHVYIGDREDGVRLPLEIWNLFIQKAGIVHTPVKIYLVNWPSAKPVVARIIPPSAQDLLAGDALILPAEALDRGHHLSISVGTAGRPDFRTFVARPSFEQEAARDFEPPADALFKESDLQVGIDMAKDGSDETTITILTESKLRASVALERNKRAGARASLFDIMAAYLAADALEAVCEECGITIDDLKAGRCQVQGGRLVPLPKGEK